MTLENSGNVVTATAADKEYEAGRDFAKDGDRSAEFTLELLSEEGATYEAGSDTFRQVDNFIDMLDDATIDFHGNNKAQLNGQMNLLLNAVEAGLHQSQGDAINGGGSVDDAKRYVSAAEWLFTEMTGGDEITGGGGDGEAIGGSGGDDMAAPEGTLDLASVMETLQEVENADTPTEKVGLLQEAISALVEALTGGGSEGASDVGGSDASSTSGASDQISEAIGDLIGGPAEPPEPATEIVTEAYSADDLMGRVWSESGRGITYDSSDGGLGIDGNEDDEIDRGEKMFFDPGGRVEGGSVTVEDLHGDSGSRATIDVIRDGEVVDTISVNGDMDGTQTVQIDQAFDTLEFSAVGRSSFAVSEVTVDREQPVEGGGIAEDSPSAGDGQIALDAAAIVELLNALSTVSNTVSNSGVNGTSVGMDDQNRLIEQVGTIMKALVGALDGDDGAAPSMSRSELAEVLTSIQELLAGVEGDVSSSPTGPYREVDDTVATKEEALEALIASITTIIEEMDASEG